MLRGKTRVRENTRRMEKDRVDEMEEEMKVKYEVLRSVH